MDLEKLFEEKKDAIVSKWFEQVVATYPADTSKFLKEQKDPFANPVGNTTAEGLKAAFSELIQPGWDEKRSVSSLNSIMKMRAVQTVFSPAQAAGFPFLLKKILRDMFRKELTDLDLNQQLRNFEDKIDQLAMIAFNLYENCREMVHRLKATEEKNRFYGALSRAGLLREVPDESPDPGQIHYQS